MKTFGPHEEKRRRPAMSLGRLLKALPPARLDGPAGLEISGLAYDSRQVQPGDLFFALPGEQTDGALYVEEAVRRGAVAIVHRGTCRLPKGIAAITVSDPRTAMADLAAEFYGQPSQRLAVVGVTGTNGKTTTVFMIRAILEAVGIPCGLIGTIQYEYGGRRIPAARTTPEAPDLQRMMAEALQAGCRALAMEVSSQGLAAGRLRGTRFAAGVFTNLSEDHLDFHHTMEAYFEAKKTLFTLLSSEAPAVVNLDDSYGRRLREELAARLRVLTFGIASAADVRGVGLTLSETGTSVQVQTPWGELPLKMSAIGRFNALNALAAIAVTGALGAPLSAMTTALERLPPVAGRLERIPDPRGRHVYVDYAHTEDALQNVLQTLRETTAGRLICVFGCGGNRDRTKRPRMGAAVSRAADVAIVTSDNPRHENPEAIIREILAGMDPARPVRVEPDRARAIRIALQEARAGDTVLIAGKGHEAYQEIAGRRVPFDDRDVARAALAEGL